GRSVLELPRESLTIEAFRGLETEIVRAVVDGERPDSAELKIRLRPFFCARAGSWQSANTHLHLKGIRREEADRYLSQVPAADGLDVLFVSYLERALADRTYVSNSYTRDELANLGRRSGVVLASGEEHRHNFGAFGEGYGHVLFLDPAGWIRPVSIGSGIMSEGPDAPPLQAGIDRAKEEGATVLWCHNRLGLEGIPSWVAGRPHAQNIFDGDPDSYGSYEDTFYRYLNAGLRVSFSTGTDWFIDDFSRVYAKDARPGSAHEWLGALQSGRTFITNGPFLDLEVDGKGPGETLPLEGPRRIRVSAWGLGRVDFRFLELIQSGKLLARVPSQAEGRHFKAFLTTDLWIDEPAWIALRTPPPPRKGEPDSGFPQNELGGRLFAHTSATSIEVGGRGVFHPEVAQGLLGDVRSSLRTISKKARFDDERQRQQVLSIYAEALSILERRLAGRGR
ncbi:MAG TPA: CehA/McbA family metallohydrolase, partial [Planctomycetota bacterium]|nr:CehA/McbA family metallohydrolase [Planctomycetota bacterium]